MFTPFMYANFYVCQITPIPSLPPINIFCTAVIPLTTNNRQIINYKREKPKLWEAVP